MDVQPDRFLRLPQVQDAVALRRSAIYALIARGEFPKPVKLGRRVACWSQREISAWGKRQLARRDAESPKRRSAATSAVRRGRR